MAGFAMPDNEDMDVDFDQTAGVEEEESEEPEWAPPASQAELDRIITQRLRRETSRYRDYDALKERASLYDQLLSQTQTDQERAAAEAEERAYNAAMGSVVPRLVRAEFRASAKGLLTGDQLDALLEDVDLTKYVSEDGEPDLDRIERKIKAVAPKTSPPSFGQGNRGQAPRAMNMNDFIRKQAGLLPSG